MMTLEQNPYQAGYSIIPDTESRQPQGTDFLDDWQLKALGSPTPKPLIRARKGQGGKVFYYVPTSFVIGILNRHFRGNWSTQLDVIHIPSSIKKGVDDNVVVKIRLTAVANGISVTKEQFGEQVIPISDSGSLGMSLGDALKSAGSDALRKAASLFGVAIDLYNPVKTDGPQVVNVESKYEAFPQGIYESPELPRESIEFTQRRAALQLMVNQLPSIPRKRFERMLVNITEKLATAGAKTFTLDNVPQDVLPNLESWVAKAIEPTQVATEAETNTGAP